MGRRARGTDAVSSELLEKCSKETFTAPCFGATTALVPQGHLVASCPQWHQFAEIWASAASELSCCSSRYPGSRMCCQTRGPVPRASSWDIHALIRAIICPQRAAKAPLHIAGDVLGMSIWFADLAITAAWAPSSGGAGGKSLCLGGKVGVTQTSACNCVSPQFPCRAQRRRRKERRSTCTCTSSSSRSGKACPGRAGSCPALASPGRGFVLLTHTFPRISCVLLSCCCP